MGYRVKGNKTRYNGHKFKGVEFELSGDRNYHT